MPVSFSCPKCESVIQISRKVPYGTPVKCPTCGRVFPNPNKYGSDAVGYAGGHDHHHRHHRSRRGRGGAGLLAKRAGIYAVLVLLLAVLGAGGYFLFTQYGQSRPTEQAKAEPTAKEPANPDTGKVEPTAKEPPAKKEPEAKKESPPEPKDPPETKKDPPEMKKDPPEMKKDPPEMKKDPPETKKEPPPPPKFVLSTEEEQLLTLMNGLRAKDPKKLAELKPNPDLFKMARAHAMAMAKLNQLDDEIEKKDTIARLKEIGYAFKGEPAVNLDVADNLQPAAAFQRWTEIAAYRENMVGPYMDVGIGIARADDGKMYYYVLFINPAQ
jgi:uncharacterized protein YkwD